jgi:hypothetical protein
MSDVPPNIQEFNTIAGLVLAQLYKAFPADAKIDREAIAGAMGAEDWNKHKLPSGRLLDQMFKDTFNWLDREGYIKTENSVAFVAALTSKGRSEMNAIGVELIKAVDQAPPSGVNPSAIGDLIGGMIGGLTKSMGS